jgi:hypothetical protein
MVGPGSDNLKVVASRYQDIRTTPGIDQRGRRVDQPGSEEGVEAIARELAIVVDLIHLDGGAKRSGVGANAPADRGRGVSRAGAEE